MDYMKKWIAKTIIGFLVLVGAFIVLMGFVSIAINLNSNNMARFLGSGFGYALLFYLIVYLPIKKIHNKFF